MLLKFTKMHTLGIDFMVVNAVTQKFFFNAEQIVSLANRHTGVGFDLLLVVEPPYDPEVDFHYRIFDADGSELKSVLCGARCCGRFVAMQKLINRKEIRVSTSDGLLRLRLCEPNYCALVVDDKFLPQEMKGELINSQYLKLEKSECTKRADLELLALQSALEALNRGGETPLTVSMPEGTLTLSYERELKLLSGPVNRIYEGSVIV